MTSGVIPVVFGLKELLLPEAHAEVLLMLPVSMFAVSGLPGPSTLNPKPQTLNPKP